MESIDHNEEFDIKIEKDIQKIFEISRIWFERRCEEFEGRWKEFSHRLKFRWFDFDSEKKKGFLHTWKFRRAIDSKEGGEK